jgi:two-component system sensor histidine kinase KdpD
MTRRWPRQDWRGPEVLVAVGALALTTGGMLLVRSHLNALNVSLIYLIAVVGVALVADRWLSIAVAVAAFLLFDWFFIPPYHTFTVARSDHILALFVFLGIATLTSQLVYQARQRAMEALYRGQQMETLYALSRGLIGDISLDPMLAAIVERVAEVLGAGACAILLPDERHQLVVRASTGPLPDPADRDDAGLAQWAFENREPTARGHSRGRVVRPRGMTQTAAPASTRVAQRQQPTLYIPIATANRTIGVLRVAQPRRGAFGRDDQQLLTTFANQAALAIERVRLNEESTRAAIAARSDELKSALLSAVSHDLRTPLASIKASATSLLQEDVNWSVEDQRDLLQAIDEETDRLTRIVGNLLDLSRIEAGVLRPQRDWNDVEEVVRETVERARPAVVGHDIQVRIESKLPALRFDYVEIGQVLINLIENAAKYSPNGAPIEVAARRDGAHVTLSVADRGLGIPLGEEERIFDKFYRLANRPGVSGAGIGLSICKGIVEAHGGRIWAERREGGGSVFRFTLPIERTVVHDEEAG